MNQNGEIVVPFNYYLENLNIKNNYILLSRNGKLAIQTFSSKNPSQFVYEKVDDFSSSRLKLKVNGGWAIVHVDSIKLPIEYFDFIGSPSNKYHSSSYNQTGTSVGQYSNKKYTYNGL